MRVVFVGGTNFVGPVAVRLLLELGHDVAIAHSGAHEHPGLDQVTHLHGNRSALLARAGQIERWAPEVLVDTFAGGATAEKAEQLSQCAQRAGTQRIIAISSMDVYQHGVEAGIGDGSGVVELPRQPIPLDESAPLRVGPYPGASEGHDNVAMEQALQGSDNVVALRPGAIYGPHPSTREWSIVELVHRRQRRLELPDGGTQLWHRVAVERVGRAIAGALVHAPAGSWTCNVVDPYDWTYAGLARRIGEILDWEWEPIRVGFDQIDHPWQTAHPCLCRDDRLRQVLKVEEPDPDRALRETVEWLWANRETMAAYESRS